MSIADSTGLNTMVPVIYRDACNYKLHASWVFTGPPTPELTERLRSALDDGLYLVAEQVGFEHLARGDDLFMLRFPDPEDDHGYLELEVDQVAPTAEEATDGRTFEQFVAACEAVGGLWDPTLAVNATGRDQGD